MNSNWRLGLAILCASFLALACSEPEVGEDCDEIGAADACEEGAICTNEESGGVCRLLCKETDECPLDHTCNGISGSNLKSCQPDKQ